MAHITSYIDIEYTDIDTNVVDSCTAWVDVTTCDALAFYIEGVTGNHTTHKIGLEMSPDGDFNGGYHMQDGSMELITGQGHKHLHDIESMKWVRLCVHTAEGSASTCNLYIQAFRHES